MDQNEYTQRQYDLGGRPVEPTLWQKIKKLFAPIGVVCLVCLKYLAKFKFLLPFLKTGLTMFMPARVWVQNGDPFVELVGWQGSGDLVGIAVANCFLVIHPDQIELAAGDWVDVMPKGQGLGSRD